MRFDLTFNLNPLRSLKPLLTIISKIGFSSKEATKSYLVYFSKEKQIRLLIESAACSIIIALDPNLICENKNLFKSEEFILFGVTFINSERVVDCLLEIVDKEKIEKMHMALTKEKAANDEVYRFLTLSCHRSKLKCEIAKP